MLTKGPPTPDGRVICLCTLECGHHISREAAAAVALERYGYEKARRIGVVAMVGGKDKVRIRDATPEPFRDLLLSVARSVQL